MSTNFKVADLAQLAIEPKFIVPEPDLFAACPSGTERRLQILRDGFDSQLEPIAFDK